MAKCGSCSPIRRVLMAAKKKLTFEERLQQVEALIAKMESGEMPLEEAMQQYEAGLNALNALEKELTAAQQRLTVLRQQSGEDIEVPMEEQQ
ncbi:MAG: exodeoxyribonuclease VII small subunit [Clostridiales bacterium]|nr:exodeoxyribonuclease VII small subunit [Clostridiales bacterium]MBD9173353.1 exodeoxyribonuclease VII small subunit [Clostridiales bacterium]MBD9284657.1 exodeoxyribonuclease VII small subunit [Clostridiales bacterium]HCE14474.1 exodeoxyribonuclease VII small subunit [Clostridiales bacterium]HCI50095.1 exodeoxyribonuclease VII small subunit [Clostridiales bacterium]